MTDWAALKKKLNSKATFCDACAELAEAVGENFAGAWVQILELKYFNSHFDLAEGQNITDISKYVSAQNSKTSAVSTPILTAQFFSSFRALMENIAENE